MDAVVTGSSGLTFTFTDVSIQAVSGTTTSWLPVITPWTQFVSCSTEVYARPKGNVIIYDPYYQTVVDPGVKNSPCLPPEATAWWDQGTDNTILLGPTFVCPSAYSAVQTITVDSVTQQTLCCPSNFGLHKPMTQFTKGAFPSQCTSVMSSGDSYVYMTSTSTSTSTSWKLYTNEITNSFTVYGIPVNGFNIQSATATSPTTTTLTTNLITSTGTTKITLAPVAATTSNSQSASTSLSELSNSATSPTTPALDIAIGVGLGVGILLLLLIIVCIPISKLWKRRRQNSRAEILYNHQDPSHQYENPSPVHYENQFPVYQHPSQETEVPPGYYPDVDEAVRDSINRPVERRTAVFEMSHKRLTDSRVKEMMEANYQELWMESPIR